MLSDNGGVGTLILGLWLVAVLASFALIGIPFAIGFWIWGMFQAYSDAVKWNASHGISS
jgi:formate hydrogenlyase subunit 3/multisubunit Na+/H+ antiporter MnhD subunit